LKENDMKRRQKEDKTDGRLPCPVCGVSIETVTTVRTPSKTIEALKSEVGEITECPSCLSMLEFGGDSQRLTVKPASFERVQAFRRLERERPGNPCLAELVSYVMKFRRKPPQRAGPRAGIVRFKFLLSDKSASL
jgi:hypothetical protein